MNTESYQAKLRQIVLRIMNEDHIGHADAIIIAEAIGAMNWLEEQPKAQAKAQVKAQAKAPVNKGTSEFETEMEINGNSYPCIVEYEDHPDDGVIIYGVTVSREVRNVYSPEGEFRAVDHKVIDLTEFLPNFDKANFAYEISRWMRKENAAAE